MANRDGWYCESCEELKEYLGTVCKCGAGGMANWVWRSKPKGEALWDNLQVAMRLWVEYQDSKIVRK